MKKYIEPKIKQIPLDPKQAILQVCKAGGQYLSLTTPSQGGRGAGCATGTTGPGPQCHWTPKGGDGGDITQATFGSTDALPS